jgi:autotransporter-associated beta strand protein
MVIIQYMVSGNLLGTDFTSGVYLSTNSAGQVATSSSSAGYGVENFLITSKVTFTGNNTYSGATTLTGSTVSRSASDGSAGVGANAYYAQTLGSNNSTWRGKYNRFYCKHNYYFHWTRGTVILNRSDTGANLSSNISSAVGNSIIIVHSGSGSYTLSGSNSYYGGNYVTNGTLKIGSASALGINDGGTSVVSGAAIDLNGITMTDTGTLKINGTGISTGGALFNSSSTGATYAGLSKIRKLKFNYWRNGHYCIK